MIKTIAENKKLYLLWIISVVLICACILTSTLLSAVAFAILMVAAVFFAPNEVLVFLIALLPFANIFKLSATSTSLFTIAEMAIVLILIFKMKRIRTSFLLVLLLFAAYLLMFSFEDLNWLLIIKMLVNFLLVYFALCKLEGKDLKNIAYMLAIGAVIMMLLTLNQNYLEYVLPYYEDVNFLVLSGLGTDMIRASGFFGDPNYCALFIVVILALLCTLYYHKAIKTEFWILFIALAVCGFFTYSKSYFLCLAALIFFLIIFVLFPKHKGWAILSAIALAVLLVLMLGGQIEVFNVMMERFQDKDLTTGRMNLNEFYLDYIWSHPMTLFFGDGIATDVIAGAGNNVHNIYIEALLKFGVVGCALYLFAFGLGIGDLKGRNKRVADFLPLVFMLVMYFFLAGVVTYDFPFYVAISFLALKFSSMTTKNKELNDMQPK